MIDPISLAGIAGAPLVVALVQLIRVSAPELPTRCLPGLTLLVAIALNLFLAWLIGTSFPLAVLIGIITGLTASGIYSQATASGRPPGASTAPTGLNRDEWAAPTEVGRG